MHCHLDIYFPPWQYVCHCLWWTVGGNRRSRPWFYPRDPAILVPSPKNSMIFPGFARYFSTNSILPSMSDQCQSQSLWFLSARKYWSAPIKCSIRHRVTIHFTSSCQDYKKIILSLVRLKCWYITFKKINPCEVRT